MVRRLPDDRRAHVIKLWKEGFRQVRIAEIMGISQNVVFKIVSEWKRTDAAQNFSRTPKKFDQ